MDNLMTGNYWEVIFLGFGVKLALCVIAWMVLLFVLKHFDKTTNFKFTDWILNERGKDSSLPLGIYLGARIIAVALLMGKILSG